jgi:hypothetical protein
VARETSGAGRITDYTYDAGALADFGPGVTVKFTTYTDSGHLIAQERASGCARREGLDPVAHRVLTSVHFDP